jgi:hypothetical protein
VKVAKWATVVVVGLGCLLAVLWVFKGPGVSDVVVDKANVVGGVAGALALAVTVWAFRPRRGTRSTPLTAAQAEAALNYLAREGLRYWRVQAKERRITTPSPAIVRWTWAREDVAVPAMELQARKEVLTAGVVTQLRKQLYARLGQDCARIVLLGEAGAGKTAAMLLLLIDVLEHRAKDSGNPVPVWLTLGGWNPEATSLQEWAATNLNRDFPGLAAVEHGGSDAAAELIRTGRLALFLDGLDEMPAAVQGKALQVIDVDSAGLRVVLASRPAQYRNAVIRGRLYEAAVVELLPVGIDEAQEFLLAEQLGERRRVWREFIRHLRANPDSVAAKTLVTPLALSLARDTYSTTDPAALFDTDRYPTPEAVLRHLLARSLILAYPEAAERKHAIQWLAWVASHMGVDRDLRWWDIPTWAPGWQRGLAAGLVGGLVFGLAVGLAVGLVGGQVSGLAAGLVFGVVFGVVGWLGGGLVLGLVIRLDTSGPRSFAARWPDRRELGQVVVTGLGNGLGGAVGGALGGVLLFGQEGVLVDRLVFGLVGGLLFMLVGGLLFGLVSVWNTPLATATATSPLEVYRLDRRRGLVLGPMFGLVGGGLVSGLLLSVVLGLRSELADGLVAGLFVGLFVGLGIGVVLGRGPAQQMVAVEVVWGLRLKPVSFMSLLQTALQRQVLRQAGAVYQFRHAALQDLLAAGVPSEAVTDGDAATAAP